MIPEYQKINKYTIKINAIQLNLSVDLGKTTIFPDQEINHKFKLLAKLIEDILRYHRKGLDATKT